MRTRTKAWTNMALFLLTLGVNALGAMGYINGLSQRVVSDRYNTLITPSPSTFSIWGLIYTLLLIALIYMIVNSKDAGTARTIDAVSPLFWLSSLANILWIVTFSFEWIGISTILIFLFVICLALLNLKLRQTQGKGFRLFALAFGIYNGWLIIASVVNAAAFLVQQGWNGFGLTPDTWAIIMMIIALVLVALIQLKLRNAALTLPLAWAYYGIWQRHTAQGAMSFNGQFPAVMTVALIGCAVYLLIAAAVFWKNGFCLLPKANKE